MKCDECGGRAQRPLCGRCVDTLGVMLTDLDWLLRELEVTAARQDRLTVGMAAASEHPWPVNISACELLRSIGAELRWIVPVPVAADPRLLVWWLRKHLDEIVARSDAGVIYRAIRRLAGTSGHGPIHDLINRPDRRFAGQCPDCQALCYARHEDVYAACPSCGLPIDVEKNRSATIVAHDLLPERVLLAVLDNLDEHVSRVRLYGWITTGRLPIAGYLSSSGVVARRGSRHDPRVYSLSRARALRRREQTPKLVLART
jgi:hypothetical protein